MPSEIISNQILHYSDVLALNLVLFEVFVSVLSTRL